jgi:hypothetical protein
METVDFITTESGDDLIVSFAIAGGCPGDVISLTLLRTPKYEFILDPGERGVNISREDILESEEDMLESIRWEGAIVRIATADGRRYELDVRRVEREEAREAKRILGTMNADHSFRMEIIQQEAGRAR